MMKTNVIEISAYRSESDQSLSRADIEAEFGALISDLDDDQLDLVRDLIDLISEFNTQCEI